MNDSQPTKAEVQAGQVYQHYKNGKRYEIVCLAKHTETEEDMVVYKPLYESRVPNWTRPLKMFAETVQHEGKTVPRFGLIS